MSDFLMVDFFQPGNTFCYNKMSVNYLGHFYSPGFLRMRLLLFVVQVVKTQP